MPIVSWEPLQAFVAEVMARLGCPPDEAEIVARSLVGANLAGHDSHGVIRVEQYARMVRAGAIVPGAPLRVVQATPVTLLLDGGWNFGQVVARRAMEQAIARAHEWGASVVSVRHSNHVGRLGEYPLMAVEAGCLAIACVNNHGVGNLVAPYGGRQARLSTNPIAIASPGPDGPILLDMTTSVVAEGKVRVRRNAGQPAPPGWLIDHLGQPTTDPNVLYREPRGAILPFGGPVAHKAYGLAVMVDILAGALSGGGCSQGKTGRLGNPIFFAVVAIERFVSREEFLGQVRALVEYVRSAPLAPGFSEILIPGEVEFREEARRRREGIPIDEETWRQLVACAAELGVAAPA